MDIRDEFNEIIDGLCMFGDLVHKQAEINQLRRQNEKSKKECGSCYHWMKTSQCPKEAMGIKVSCGMLICSNFEMDSFTQRFIDENELKIKQLQSEISTSN